MKCYKNILDVSGTFQTYFSNEKTFSLCNITLEFMQIKKRKGKLKETFKVNYLEKE